MIRLLIILLPLFALLIWVLKSRRYADGFFLITAAASMFTFFRGFSLLDPYTDAKWQGVVLISVSLIAMLVAAIAFKVLAQRDALRANGSARNTKLEAEQASSSNGGNAPV